MKTKVFTIVVVLILLFWVFRGSYQGTKCNGLENLKKSGESIQTCV